MLNLYSITYLTLEKAFAIADNAEVVIFKNT